MSEFHFLRPFWLLAFIPLVAFSWQFYRSGREGGDWRRVCDPDLLPYILVHDGGGQPARRASFWFALGGCLAILALAGPVWERLPAPAFRNDAALVIAFDLSRMMDAADLKPSRLERARFKIADILKERKDGLTALLVYSGDAFTVTPLTDDVATITAQLSALTSDLMPTQGSRADLALERAGQLLKQAGLTRGDVLLITDGGSLTKAADAAKSLHSQGYRVSVLGAGSEDGAPVPLAEGGFLQDTKGNIIISKLATPALRQVAEVGGGVFRKLTADNADLDGLLGLFGQPFQQGKDAEAKGGATIEQWEERGPWLLLLLLPIAALAFRRGVLAVLVLLALPMPRSAHALEWQELWQTRDQRASRAMQAGDAAQAAEAFADPAWKAAAQYRAGKFDEAAETLESLDTADAHYNRGNALAKAGDLPGAVVAYDKALKLDPRHEDARHNLEVVEKALEEQQKKQDQQQDKNKQGQGNQQNQEQEQKQGQQGQQNDQGKQGQQDQQNPGQGKQDRQDGQGKQDQQEQNGKESGQNSEQSQGQERQQGQPGEKQQGRQDPANKPENPQGKEPAAGEKGREEQKKQAEEGAGQAEADKPKPGGQEAKAAAMEGRKSEERQADEQWLRRIPDDPGGLLRRKFLYQYQQRQGGTR